jgi:hypothetical protein
MLNEVEAMRDRLPLSLALWLAVDHAKYFPAF